MDPVVSDGSSGPKALLHVALLEHPSSGREVPPHSCKAVGLKLHRNGLLVPHPRLELLHLTDLPLDSEDRLNVMPDLVGKDVGLREVSGCPEPGTQLVVERQIDVDLSVTWTVEGPRCRLGEPTRGPDGLAEEDQLSVLVSGANLRKNLGPGVLNVDELWS